MARRRNSKSGAGGALIGLAMLAGLIVMCVSSLTGGLRTTAPTPQSSIQPFASASPSPTDQGAAFANTAAGTSANVNSVNVKAANRNAASINSSATASKQATTNLSSGGVNDASAAAGAIIGNRKSKIYHWQGCPNYADVAAGNQVLFQSATEAESAGYRAARNCNGSSPPGSGGSALNSVAPVSTRKQQPLTETKSAPAGASARCRDGSLSYSQSRRGTCSHHGGVAVWY